MIKCPSKSCTLVMKNTLKLSLVVWMAKGIINYMCYLRYGPQNTEEYMSTDNDLPLTNPF